MVLVDVSIASVELYHLLRFLARIQGQSSCTLQSFCGLSFQSLAIL